jgi:hypothetical protein
MLRILKSYWTAVANVFPAEWQESPRRSRLVHGVGIVSMGCLMDEIVYVLGEERPPTTDELEVELRRIAGKCHWMNGEWEFNGAESLPWNELQNTPKHILRLTDHLLAVYRDLRPGRGTQDLAA